MVKKIPGLHTDTANFSQPTTADTRGQGLYYGSHSVWPQPEFFDCATSSVHPTTCVHQNPHTDPRGIKSKTVSRLTIWFRYPNREYMQ
jgi:hypothetical protein